MAREQVDMTTGTTPAADIDFSATTDATTFDVFVGNQGEGAMRVTLNWTTADFSAVFIPPHAHRDSVNLSPGDVVHLDSLEILQLVAERPAGGSATTFSATGQKTHITAASTGNDYIVVGVGARG